MLELKKKYIYIQNVKEKEKKWNVKWMYRFMTRANSTSANVASRSDESTARKFLKDEDLYNCL